MNLKDPKKVPAKEKVLPKLELEVQPTEPENNTEESEETTQPEVTTPIVDGIELEDEDDTIFYFTNNSDEDWSTRWNKVEYTFPAKRRTRMAIRGESPENVQSIRKMFATRYAVEQYAKTSDFQKRATPIENKNPIAYNATVLQPFIDSCLNPLPKARIISQRVESNEDQKFEGGTQPLPDNAAPYDVFKDAPVKVYGEMPNE